MTASATVGVVTTFDAAHRLWKYDGMCAFLHGHTYRAEVSVSGPVREDGMVVDFVVLKKAVVGSCAVLDHATVLEHGDPLIMPLREAEQDVILLAGPPTAERIARWLLDDLRSDAPRRSWSAAHTLRVRVYETPTSWAEVSG